MPKRKTDPVFATAKALHGIEKISYLANGNLDKRAARIVEDIKTWTRAKKEYRKQNPYSGTNAEERLSALLASCDRQMEEAYELVAAAIMANDADVFRLVADVLGQHVANHERPVTTPFGDWIHRDASDPLATDIACWAEAVKNSGEALQFSALWKWLAGSKRWGPTYGNRGTAARLKSAQTSVRATAKGIGISFAPEKPGPKQ